jgi:D-threo-aldose 1-dehydrogenase
MDPFGLVDVGRTGLKVTRLGLGGTPLGNAPPLLSDQEAIDTIRRALALGMRYVDTAAYGEGRSELRYGEALADVPRDSYVISTKVGVVLKRDGVQDVDFEGIDLTNLPKLEPVFDFSRDAVLRAFESSLQRLRLERVDILLLHVVPPEHYQTAIDEGFPALAELRSQGVVKAIGAGLTPLNLLLRFVREADFDCFLLPNRYTLTEQTAIEEFLPICQERDIAVIIGAPYNNGRMLGRIADHIDRVKLGPQTPEELAAIRRCQNICDRYEVPIRAAALQFVVAHPSVVSVLPGPASMEEMTDNIRMMQHSIPPEFWAEMLAEGVITSDCPVPVE